MRRVALAIVSTAVALVLILSFKSHSTTSLATPSAAVSTTSGSSTSSGGSTVKGSTGSSGSTKVTTPKKPTTTTVTGDAADTRYGPVQVRITVKNGTITAAGAVDYPTAEPQDQQINGYAIPILNQEATKAGNAQIDLVSGATFTSQGYIQSLQSALDKAKA